MIPRPAKAMKTLMPSKTNTMDNAKQVIDKLGKARAVADKFGIPISTVRSWRDRGVPAHVIADDSRLARALKRAGYERTKP